MTLKFDGWPSKTIGHLFYATSSFVQHFVAIGELKLELQCGNAQFGHIRWFFEPCDLEIWQMTLKNNRAPFLSIIKLYASFHHHMWIRTGVTVRKPLSWVVTSVTLTFDLWPWPCARTSLLSLVITPENFIIIRWREHSKKNVTDGQTDRRTEGQTDWTIHRDAWSWKKNTADGFAIRSTGAILSLFCCKSEARKLGCANSRNVSFKKKTIPKENKIIYLLVLWTKL